MALKPHEFLDSLLKFTEESNQWCIKQSEIATANVTDTLSALMNDAKRISKMSSDTLNAVNEIKKKLSKSPAGSKSSKFIEDLKKLCSQEDEVAQFAFPVIEALQFQDRTRQNIENIMKMFSAWKDFRKQLVKNGGLTDGGLTVFGEKLMKCTTMNEEREIICKHIGGLGSESGTSGNAQLF